MIVLFLIYSMDIGISHCGELVYVAVIFFISVNFCFSFVLNSLALITITKNNGKVKMN